MSSNVKIRSPIIVVLGHVDHGKCLHPEEVVFTEEGPIKIKELVENDKAPKIFVYKEKVERIKEYIKVKRKHKGYLVKIVLEDGSEIRVTPEHTLLTTDGWKPANEIKENDKIAVTLKYPIERDFNDFKKKLLEILINNEESIFILNNQAKEKLPISYKSRINRFRGEDVKILVKDFGHDFVWNSIEYFGFTTRKQRAGHIKAYIKFPKDFKTWKQIFYLVGLFFADGFAGENKIANNCEIIHNFIKELAEKLELYSEVKSGRTVQIIEIKGAKQSFIKLLKYVFEYPERKKAHNLKIPEILWFSPKEFIGAFVGGLIDGNGYIDTKNCNIEITSASKEFIYGLKYLLLVLGVFSKVRKKGKYYMLFISGKRNLENLSKYLYLLSKRKDFELLLKKVKKDNIYVPIIPSYLKYLRLAFGLTKLEIGIPFYKKYEDGKQKITLYVWEKFVEKLKPINIERKIAVLEGKIKDPNLIKAFQSDGLINEKGELTDLGKELLKIWKERLYEKIHIPNFKEITFVRVIRIEKIPYEGFVYDLSTETYTFIANGIIVHNTTLLDKIRGTAIAQKEAGGITQHIGATEIPIEVIKKIAGPLTKIFKFEFKIPGLLFIDTPGHEAFTNLRRRGGSVADFAIVVIDILEGFKPQTYESIEICKQFKVPFLIAANKIDRIDGWKPYENEPFLETIKKQRQDVQQKLDELLYSNIIGPLYELGFEAERFDRVKDFLRQVAVVPVSAKTGEGIPELLLLVAGITQRFLEKKLRINVSGPGKGVVLEKKEVKGLGDVIDVILYDGIIRKGDLIAVAGKNGVVFTKVRALLKPLPLKEIRDKSAKFKEVEEVAAAAGIRIAAPGLEDALVGSPLFVIWDEKDIPKVKKEIEKEIGSFLFEEEKEGVIVKADTLGTLEAIVKILKEKGIPIRKADIGNITKKDILLAYATKEKEEKWGVILAFNVGIEKSAEEELKKYNVKIIQDNVIYRLIEKFEQWLKEVEEMKRRKILEELVPPCKFKILHGFVFRRSNPAIVGIEILGGMLRPGVSVMREDGVVVGTILSIQSEGKPLKEAKKGDKVAVAIQGPIVGRHIKEGDTLYTYVPEAHFKKYKELKQLLTEDEKEVLKEIAKIMRKINPTWGI